jgi:hypothetical protein
MIKIFTPGFNQRSQQAVEYRIKEHLKKGRHAATYMISVPKVKFPF